MGTVRRSMPLRLLPAWLLVALPTVGAFLPSPPSLCRSRLPSTSCSPSSVSHHPRLPAPAPHRRAGLGGVRSTQALVLSGPVGAISWAFPSTVLGLVISEATVLILSGVFVTFCGARYGRHARWQLPSPLPSAIEAWITAAFVAGFVLPVILVVAGTVMGFPRTLLVKVFVPYFLGVIAQLLSWRSLGFRGSPAWPLVPIPFILWRLVQLSRGAAIFTAAGAPWIFPALLQGVLLPFWAMALFGHVLLWPALYKWPLENFSLSTPVGPVPANPLSQIDTGGERMLEELEQTTQERDRLQMRANNLRRMDPRRGGGRQSEASS